MVRFLIKLNRKAFINFVYIFHTFIIEKSKADSWSGVPCILLVQYLTLRDVWKLGQVDHAASLCVSQYAHTMAADDKFDSFFELDKHDSFYFLHWCGQHDISVKRLFVQISSEKTRDQTAENLQKLVEKYLRKFGSTVLAVSLKFTFNCSSGWSYFIKTVFKHCPNLIMFSLNAEMLDLEPWHAMKIFKEVTKCPSFLSDLVHSVDVRIVLFLDRFVCF